MHERLEKIKTHIKDNKVTYIACGATAVVTGVVVYVAVKYKMEDIRGSEEVIQGVNFIEAPSLKINSPTTINVTQNLIRRMHPGFRILNNKTGEEFASMRRTCELMGMTMSELRKHLDGEIPDINGMTFSVLGEM